MVSLPGAHRHPRTALIAALAMLILALATAALLAPVAEARVVQGEGSGGVRAGIQPRASELGLGGNMGAFANPSGNAVLASSDVYAIYWDPGYRYHGDWQRVIDGFLHNFGAESGSLAPVFAVDGQYTDAAGQHSSYSASFGGAYVDTTPYPTPAGCEDPAPLGEGDAVTCLSNAQIQSELTAFISAHSLPRGMGTVYYLLTPPGVTTCLEGGGPSGRCSDYEGTPTAGNASYERSFCSYHSYIGAELPDGGPSTVLYAVIPWTAGGLGDYQLAQANRTPGYRCQDGGWNPAGKTGEQEESPPVQQEPNQEGRGPDGSYDTGLADLIVNQIAAEQQDIVTDPLLNAWQEPATGNEAIDECRDVFGLTIGGSVAPQTGTEAGTLYNQVIGGADYYLNDAFNLAAVRQGFPGVPCVTGVHLDPQFTVPTSVNAGETVAFDGAESDITLDAGQGYTMTGTPFETYPTYHWSFGDGTETAAVASPAENPVDEPAAFHSYTYGGTYTVTLTVTDTGGNTASVSRELTVSGPAPPPPPAPPSGSAPAAPSAASTAPTPSGSNSKHHGTRAKTLAKPVVEALALTSSLQAALKRGLRVRYAVNEQVAGYFEVLIPTKLAKHLHIHGHGAKWLHKGRPGETAIAYRLLVTTRKAHGRIRIEIPHSAAGRLRKLRRLKLTLRLVVRNAALQKPKIAHLQSVVTLKRPRAIHAIRASHHHHHKG